MKQFTNQDLENRMPNKDETEKQPSKTASKSDSQVLQAEKLDFVDLVPTDRPRAQAMRGFDPIYTDIVDYIIRCTHRIWDERNVGLIYTHYTHDCIVYSALGTK